MPELAMVVVLAMVVGVVGVAFGMLLAPQIARLDDRIGRDEEADER